MSTADIDAIQDFFNRTSANTLVAQTIKDKFTVWVNGLGWYDKTTDATLDLARNQRNDFNLANATTPEDKQVVQEIITGGLTSEQMQGQADRRLSDGSFPGPKTPPAPPLIPTPYLVGGAIVGGLALIAWAYGEGRK